jgi:hypothetical protein
MNVDPLLQQLHFMQQLCCTLGSEKRTSSVALLDFCGTDSRNLDFRPRNEVTGTFQDDKMFLPQLYTFSTTSGHQSLTAI